MEQINIEQALPEVFRDGRPIKSDIWNTKTEFQKGKVYLVEAASGTGKSSLLSFIYGYRCDFAGKITFDGQDVRSLKANDWAHIRQNSLSILFQDLRLFPELTAWENILIKNNLTHHKAESEIDAWFDALGIGDKKQQLCGKLSFGQQQRVAMIRALCQPFDFIFLDEPISHLDEQNSQTMAQLLLEEARKQGAGIVATSIGKHMELHYDTLLKL
ncbi:MAG: ATP-binding cassette domain-containing protein [Bacteroidaceae bacterium]|jgi:putative ABC transport system ATP-binding protein